MDSSFLTDLNVTSSLISRSLVMSLMGVFWPMRSYTALSVSVRSLCLRVAAA